MSPVVASAEREVDADSEIIWEILSSINHWPEWNADVKSATLQGQLAPGSEFIWKAGYATIVSRISEVQRPYILAWTGMSMGIRAIHIWTLEKRGEKVLVKTEESWEGFIPRLLRWPIQKILESSIDSWLEHLKAEAERRADL